MSTEQPQFTEEELRQIEAEMERITVDDVLLQTIVTLLNLAARKAGLAAPPGEGEPKRDLEQVRDAIEGARALLPMVEPRHGEQLGQVKQMLSQLQMAYAQLAQGGGGAAAGRGPPAGRPGERGARARSPAERGPGRRGPRAAVRPALDPRAVAARPLEPVPWRRGVSRRALSRLPPRRHGKLSALERRPMAAASPFA